MILDCKTKKEIAARVKCWSYDSSSRNKGMEFDLAVIGQAMMWEIGLDNWGTSCSFIFLRPSLQTNIY